MSAKVRLTLLLLGLTTAACYTWRTEPLSPVPTPTFLPWHRVRITRVDGHKQVVVDPSVTADTLYAWENLSHIVHVAVPLSHIQRLESSHFSAGKTIGLALGFPAGVALAVAVAVEIACSGPGPRCGGW